jgi:Ca-activated chloride channel family protein
MMFQFAHPALLYALAAIPLLTILFVLSVLSRNRRIRMYGDPALVRLLMPEFSHRKPWVKFVLLMCSLSFLILAMAGPRYGTRVQNLRKKGSEIIIALDVSNSMLAGDIQPNRLERSKQAISRLVDRLGDDKIGLIVFAGEAYTQLPVTTDYVSAKMFLSTIQPDLVPVQGTAIGRALDLALKSFSPNAASGKAIIVITDGENHEDDPVASAARAAEQGVQVHAVGVGSPQGTPIPVPGTAGREFWKDASGNVVLSRLDEQVLRQMTEAGKGVYVRASAANMGLNTLFEEINRLKRSEYDVKVYTDYAEVYPWAIGVSLMFLLLELIISNRRNKFRLAQWNIVS